jgi:hypothetical protein
MSNRTRTNCSPDFLFRNYRITVKKVRRRNVDATIKDGRAFHVKHRRGGWSCDCPNEGTCRHIDAVARIAPLPWSERKAVRWQQNEGDDQ